MTIRKLGGGGKHGMSLIIGFDPTYPKKRLKCSAVRGIDIANGCLRVATAVCTICHVYSNVM